MKIFPYLFSLIFLMPIFSFGQIDLSVQVGAGLQRFWGDFAASRNEIPTYNSAVQVSLGYPLSKRWSIHATPGYQFFKSFGEADLTDAMGNDLGRINLDQRSNVIILPVLLGTSFGRKRNFLFQAGPYVSWTLRTRQITEPIDSPFPPQDLTFGGSFNPSDYGLRGALGWEIPLDGQTRFQIWLLHDRGLKGTLSNSGIRTGLATYQLMLGLGL